MTTPILKLIDVSKSYVGTNALTDISSELFFFFFFALFDLSFLTSAAFFFSFSLLITDAASESITV